MIPGNDIRKYGQPPYEICLVHGGPGASGEMEPVAQALSYSGGTLEPFQNADSLRGQLDELKQQIGMNGDPPVVLIGFSYGAWLSFLFAAQYPDLVKKLILISSGPFDKIYAPGIQKTRMGRFSLDERKELEQLVTRLQTSDIARQNDFFRHIGAMVERADAFDPDFTDKREIKVRYEIYRKVWPEADELRKSGELLGKASQIQCPVVAIHGDYDPHPWKGVRDPLSGIVREFRFILLDNCGHKPWIEKQARERFYEILKEEINR